MLTEAGALVVFEVTGGDGEGIAGGDGYAAIGPAEVGYGEGFDPVPGVEVEEGGLEDVSVPASSQPPSDQRYVSRAEDLLVVYILPTSNHQPPLTDYTQMRIPRRRDLLLPILPLHRICSPRPLPPPRQAVEYPEPVKHAGHLH